MLLTYKSDVHKMVDNWLYKFNGWRSQNRNAFKACNLRLNKGKLCELSYMLRHPKVCQFNTTVRVNKYVCSFNIPAEVRSSIVHRSPQTMYNKIVVVTNACVREIVGVDVDV